MVLPLPSALLTLLQYYCTTGAGAQHTTPYPTPLVYSIYTLYIICNGNGNMQYRLQANLQSPNEHWRTREPWMFCSI